jgi:hypothetical protein
VDPEAIELIKISGDGYLMCLMRDKSLGVAKIKGVELLEPYVFRFNELFVGVTAPVGEKLIFVSLKAKSFIKDSLSILKKVFNDC